jgi:hypothetical protein
VPGFAISWMIASVGLSLVPSNPTPATNHKI